ncbi:MAG: hypothetical protein L0154_26075 [Chloroflexi bacterium]|nr:hypothetical protein [Chloroflexota bacterium]
MRKIALLLCTFILGLTIVTFAPTMAQNGGNGLIPTPTAHPIDELVYDLTTAGGEDITLTFDGIEQDGLTLGETEVSSNYPRGMEFAVTASSGAGDIVDVILFMQFVNGSSTRFAATYDDETEQWTARPWDTGSGQPAWTQFEFYWRIRDEEGNSLDGPTHAAEYWDPTREWNRVETGDVIIYWFGFEEVSAEYVAEGITLAVGSTEPRRIEGFGGRISYKPVGVVYPDRETLGEFQGSGLTNSNAAGYTSDSLGMTIQSISVPTEDWFERQANCIYLTPLEDRTEQFRVDDMIFRVVPHEIAHLYQFDKGVNVGPNWWVEGQADYFTYEAGNYDSRLVNLATLQDAPSLEGNISAFTYEADGCYALAYDMGVSFINWLLTNYGGLETHAQIVDLLSRNIVLADAIEQVVGVSFVELQNEWRTYLGYEPFSAEDLDPSLALGEPIDPLYLVGDIVQFPGPSPETLHVFPGPNQISNAACFAGLDAEIVRVGSLDGVNYYEINCAGLTGWVEEGRLP